MALGRLKYQKELVQGLHDILWPRGTFRLEGKACDLVRRWILVGREPPAGASEDESDLWVAQGVGARFLHERVRIQR